MTVVLLLAAGLLYSFSSTLIDGYCKHRLERAFSKAHPGYRLTIGRMEYRGGDNELVGYRVVIVPASTNGSGRIETVSLRGVRWWELLRRRRTSPEALSQVALDAKDVNWVWPTAPYSLHCDQVRGSLRSGELIAEGIHFGPASTDEEFFAARQFRRTRFDLRVPRLRVVGLTNSTSQSSYCVQTVEIDGAALDTLTNREKPIDPHPKEPWPFPQALEQFHRRLTVQRLNVRGGEIRLGHRLDVGTQPGYLTFDDLEMRVEAGALGSSSNSTPWILRGEAKLMKAATFRLDMQMPMGSPTLSLHYSGSLAGMDLAKLNPFTVVAAGANIKAGTLHEAQFNVDVRSDHATGQFLAAYEGLDLVLLDKNTRSEKGVVNRVKTFVTDEFILRRENMPTAKSQVSSTGIVDYTRKPGEKFLHFVWFALRSGMVDLLGLRNWVKESK